MVKLVLKKKEANNNIDDTIWFLKIRSASKIALLTLKKKEKILK